MNKIKIFMLMTLVFVLTGCDSSKQVTLDAGIGDTGIEVIAQTHRFDEIVDMPSAQTNLQDLRLKGEEEKFLTFDTESSSHIGSYEEIEDIYHYEYLYQLGERQIPIYSKTVFSDNVSYGKNTDDLKGKDSTDGTFDPVFSFPSMLFEVKGDIEPVTATQKEIERAKFIATEADSAFNDYFKIFKLEEGNTLKRDEALNAIARDFSDEYHFFTVDGARYTIYVPSELIYWNEEKELEALKNDDIYTYRYKEFEYDGYKDYVQYAFVWGGHYTETQYNELEARGNIRAIQFGWIRGYGTILEERYDISGKSTLDKESEWIKLNQLAIKAVRNNNHRNLNMSNPEKFYNGFTGIIAFALISAFLGFFNWSNRLFMRTSTGSFLTSDTFAILAMIDEILLPILITVALYILGWTLIWMAPKIAQAKGIEAFALGARMVGNIVKMFAMSPIYLYGLRAALQVNDFLSIFNSVGTMSTLSVGEAFLMAVYGGLFLYLTALFPILFVYGNMHKYGNIFKVIRESLFLESFNLKELSPMLFAMIAPSLVIFFNTTSGLLIDTLAFPSIVLLLTKIVIFILSMALVEAITGVPIIHITKLVNQTGENMAKTGAAGMGLLSGGLASIGSKMAGKNKDNPATKVPDLSSMSNQVDGISGDMNEAKSLSNLHGKTDILKTKDKTNVKKSKGELFASGLKGVGKWTAQTAGNASLAASSAASAIQGGMIMSAGGFQALQGKSGTGAAKIGAQVAKDGTKGVIENGFNTIVEPTKQAINSNSGKMALAGDVETQTATGVAVTPVSAADLNNQFGVQYSTDNGQLAVKVNPEMVRKGSVQSSRDYNYINNLAKTEEGMSQLSSMGYNSVKKNKSGDVSEFKMSPKIKANKGGKEFELNNFEANFRANAIEPKGNAVNYVQGKALQNQNAYPFPNASRAQEYNELALDKMMQQEQSAKTKTIKEPEQTKEA